MGGGGRVWGVIFMSLLYYMFQSILNMFAFVFWCEKINYFHGWGGPPPPFAENSAKIINSILMEDYLRWKTTFNGRRPSMEDDRWADVGRGRVLMGEDDL